MLGQPALISSLSFCGDCFVHALLCSAHRIPISPCLIRLLFNHCLASIALQLRTDLNGQTFLALGFPLPKGLAGAVQRCTEAYISPSSRDVFHLSMSESVSIRLIEMSTLRY